MFLGKQHHIAIIASSWEKAREFYIEKLGFELFREVYRPAQNDYLRLMAKPLYRCLQKVRATARLKIYGTRKEKNIGHVFHLNCKLPLAHRCNDDQAAFFRAHMKL